jgi:hypothetical protein
MSSAQNNLQDNRLYFPDKTAVHLAGRDCASAGALCAGSTGFYAKMGRFCPGLIRGKGPLGQGHRGKDFFSVAYKRPV